MGWLLQPHAPGNVDQVKLVKLTFCVKHIKLSRWLHVLLSPFTSNLLVMLAIQYSLVNPPEIKMRYIGTAGKILNAAN
jgi:hypothetical protein